MLDIALWISVGGLGLFFLGWACGTKFMLCRAIRARLCPDLTPDASETKPKPKPTACEKLLAKLRAEEEKKPIPPKPDEFEPPPKEDIVLVEEYYALVNEDLESLGIDRVFRTRYYLDLYPRLFDARWRIGGSYARSATHINQPNCLICGRPFDHDELVLCLGECDDYAKGAWWYYRRDICVDRKVCRKYAESKGRDLRKRSGKWRVDACLSDTRMSGIKYTAKKMRESPEGLVKIAAQIAAKAKAGVKAAKAKGKGRKRKST